MFKKILVTSALISFVFISGCASVPMASINQDTAMKTFAPPSSDKAGLYIFRDTFRGQGMKKKIYIDGVELAESANKVYFYIALTPGTHTISTADNYDNHKVTFTAESGKNYFAEQFIEMRLTDSLAGIKMVSDAAGKAGVLQSNLATSKSYSEIASSLE